MFCSKCGAEIAESAKFCSECGTKVEETQAGDFKIPAYSEPAGVQENVEEKAMSMEEAFKEKVSFDWSNVIDEPQKREVPHGIKSPWAATAGNIDEKDFYAEMTQSDDKNRTMSFIDVLKANKEERERAALDKSIEYTEVLEIDPELLGGVKPPKMHYAPLYEDVDEPVKTPFDFDDTVDAYATGQLDRLHIEEKTEEKEEKGTPAAEFPASEAASPKFELPDFLKKAKGFVGGGDSKENYERIEKAEEIEPTVEDAVSEKTNYAFSLSGIKETVDDVEEAAEDKVEETAAEAAGEAGNAVTDDTANIYLDLEMSSNENGAERVSRATAHALAGDYDDDDDDNADAEEAKAVDEKELFSEMNETPGSRSGMTIAAPADEESEIEALKRRLAELTGTIEMDSALINEEGKEAEADVKEDEPKLEDFTFEPEVTAAEDKLFAGLTAASETAAAEAIAVDEPTSVEALEFAAPKLEDFAFEPEVTTAEDKLFEGLAPASDTLAAVTEVQTAETPITETPVVEAHIAEITDTEPSTTGLSATQQSAFDSLADNLSEEETAAEPDIPAPATETEVPAFGLEPENAAPSATTQNASVGLEPEPAVIDFASKMAERESRVADSSQEPAKLILEDFTDTEPVTESPVVGFAEPEATKPTDAVSLEDLEKDLFGPVETEDGAEAETTKKIDKFYTLYRKNEEFQRLLDEEYSRLKGEHIEVSEEEVNKELGITNDAGAAEADPIAAEKAAEEEAPMTAASQDIAAALKDIAKESRPVEDDTIYRMEMPDELKAYTQKTEEKTDIAADITAVEAPTAESPKTEAPTDKTEKKKGLFGKSKDKKSKDDAKEKDKKKEENITSFGLDGKKVGGTATGAAAETAAGAVFANADAEAEKSKSIAQTSTQPEVVYQDVDGGSTILTILAVLVAILLVFLLVIILVMHLAPDSGIALTVDQVIENITSRFSALDTLDGLKWL